MTGLILPIEACRALSGVSHLLRRQYLRNPSQYHRRRLRPRRGLLKLHARLAKTFAQ